MIEFAAGIMVGGSVGAVIMGALLAQTRSAANNVRAAAALHARARMQAPRHMPLESAQHDTGRHSWSAVLQGRSTLAAASQLH